MNAGLPIPIGTLSGAITHHEALEKILTSTIPIPDSVRWVAGGNGGYGRHQR